MPEDLTFLERRRDAIYKNLQESVQLCRLNYCGKKELATETDETVLGLCEALEDAFFYGLRGESSPSLTAAFLGQMQEMVTGNSSAVNNNMDSFWDFCQIYLTAHEKERYVGLKQVWNSCGHGRAFIRATLNENSLRRYVLTWLNDKPNLEKFYAHWALLTNAEMAEQIAKMLAELEEVLFALTIDSSHLNFRKRLAKLYTCMPLAREEPLIYAPTPEPASSNSGTKRKVKERPIASTTSVEDLLAALQGNALSPKQTLSLDVVAKEEQPTLPTYSSGLPTDSIEPELEFLKTPLPDLRQTPNNYHHIVNSNHKLEDNISDDTSSQYSKSSSANYCTISSSTSPSASSQQLADTEERLQKMTANCLTLETRVAQLSLENRQLLRRLKQIFEATGIDPASTVAGYNFLITIPQVQLLKTRRNTSSYYAYEVHITMRQHLEHWSVLRRYRDFHKLHQSLLRTHPSILAGIAFPPKRHFGNMNSVFVEERRAQLQIYLLHVVESLPQVEACKSKSELQKAFPFFRQK